MDSVDLSFGKRPLRIRSKRNFYVAFRRGIIRHHDIR